MSKQLLNDFLIADAARLSGLTSTMVDYLCRTGVLVPSVRGRRGRGSPRRYSFGDVVMLRAIARLLGGGVSVLRLKKALQEMRHFQHSLSASVTPTKYLVSDGKHLYLRNKSGLLDMDGSGQMSFCFVLELRAIHNEVRKAAVGE